MMSNNRGDYGSATEWLSVLRHDEAWLCQQQQLQQSSADNLKSHLDAAKRRIGSGLLFEYWEIYHQVESAVCEVWEISELTLPKLKIQTIGLLSMEWLEQHASDNRSLETEEQSSAIVDRLKPIFYGSEQEARSFLESIQGMRPIQITDKVNQLVDEKKISVLSCHRELWKVLHDFDLYKRTEANWNMQVK